MPVHTRRRARPAEAEETEADADVEVGAEAGGELAGEGEGESLGRSEAKRRRVDAPSLPSSSLPARSVSGSPLPPTRPQDFKQVDVSSRPALAARATPVQGVWYVPGFLPSSTASKEGDGAGGGGGISRFFAGASSRPGQDQDPSKSQSQAQGQTESQTLTSPALYAALRALPSWYRPTLRVYGRAITQSRAIIAFSKVPGLPLRYSGVDVEMHSCWPSPLKRLERRVRECVGEEVRFNHAMLNLYPDG